MALPLSKFSRKRSSIICIYIAPLICPFVCQPYPCYISVLLISLTFNFILRIKVTISAVQMKCFFMDFSSIYIVWFTPSFFFDMDHLTKWSSIIVIEMTLDSSSIIFPLDWLRSLITCLIKKLLCLIISFEERYGCKYVYVFFYWHFLLKAIFRILHKFLDAFCFYIKNVQLEPNQHQLSIADLCWFPKKYINNIALS